MRIRTHRLQTSAAFLLVIPAVVFLIDCSTAKTAAPSKPFPVGDYDYTSYDEQGAKVVEGRISITSSEERRVGPEIQTQLKGNWELKKVGKQQHIGGQEGKGELIGSVIKGEIYLDLNPNINDANVLLHGKIEGKRFHGTWSFNGYAGPLMKGAFEATKK